MKSRVRPQCRAPYELPKPTTRVRNKSNPQVRADPPPPARFQNLPQHYPTNTPQLPNNYPTVTQKLPFWGGGRARPPPIGWDKYVWGLRLACGVCEHQVVRKRELVGSVFSRQHCKSPAAQRRLPVEFRYTRMGWGPFFGTGQWREPPGLPPGGAQFRDSAETAATSTTGPQAKHEHRNIGFGFRPSVHQNRCVTGRRDLRLHAGPTSRLVAPILVCQSVLCATVVSQGTS